MKTAFRFRLYPNRRQERRLLRMVEAGRRLWNDALSHRKRRWEEQRLSTSYSQQCWILTAERRADPLLGELYSQAGQDVLRRLERAFEAFFEHRAKYPKFKKFSESGSFTYPQAYNGSVRPDAARKRLFLSKAGNVKAVFHRGIPPSEKLKTCTVIREPSGEWYSCLTYDDGVVSLQDVRVPGSWKAPIGVDLGLKSLIVTSDGEKVEHPKFLRKAEKRLKRLQRGFSSAKKGSNGREKARRLLAVQHARVSNRRMDFNHKLSAELARKHDLIVFEDLKVRNMVRNHALAKSIGDAGWCQLVSFTQYKADRRGKLLAKVPPAYTTQECCFCGTLNQITLDVREFECVGCHRWLDRDVNAARVTLKRGIAKVGQDRTPSGSQPGGESPPQGVPELKPVETRPLLLQTTGGASPVVEAGTIRGGCHATQQDKKPTAGSPRLQSWEDVTRSTLTTIINPQCREAYYVTSATWQLDSCTRIQES